MQALNRIEDKLKCNIAKIDWNNLTVKQTATVMWAGLVHEDNKLTPDKIMELVDRHSSYNKAAERLMEAITTAFGAQEEEKND